MILRDAEEYLQQGRTCRLQGRFPEAETALRKALECEPQNGGVRFELGALYQDQNRFIEAAAEFERAIVIDPNMVGAHGQLGRMYRRQGRLFEAEAAWRKALECDPQNGGVRFELGALYVEQGEFRQAAEELERVIALDQNHCGAHLQLARIYRRQGRAPEAEAFFQKVVAFDPGNGGVRVELGILCEEQGRFIAAAAELERAVALESGHGEAHCLLGRIYRRQGRWSDAEQALNRGLTLDPQCGWAHAELGALYQGQERFAEAAGEFEKAITIDPNNAGHHLGLGHVHLRLGQWAGAVGDFQNAASLSPGNDGAYIGLWAAYRGQDKLSEARAALTKALAIAPMSAMACTEWLDRLDRDRVIGGTAKEPMRDRVFCLLPWTHLHVFTDGLFRPCPMWSGPPLGDARASPIDEVWNSPIMKALRLDMMSGRSVAGCWRCYEAERLGFLSTRKRNSIELGHHCGRERLTAPDGTLPRLPVPFLDIRVSNACNLRCRICGPTQSSAWAADAEALGLPAGGGPTQRTYDDWNDLWRQLQPLLEDGIELIDFVGGEPLVTEEHYRILDFLIARKLTDVRLRYNTNFSTLRFQGRDVIGLWSRFDDVRVVASLDGSGRRGEYLRKGLRWDTVVANREEMLRRCPDVGFSISATFSIFNALHLPDFHREWVEKGYIARNEFALNLLLAPAMYRMQVLPASLKQRVLESYQQHRGSFLNADGPAARDFVAAERFLQEQDYSELLPGFMAMTRRLDRLRGEDCREVFPELASLFEAA